MLFVGILWLLSFFRHQRSCPTMMATESPRAINTTLKTLFKVLEMLLGSASTFNPRMESHWVSMAMAAAHKVSLNSRGAPFMKNFFTRSEGICNVVYRPWMFLRILFLVPVGTMKPRNTDFHIAGEYGGNGGACHAHFWKAKFSHRLAGN